MIIQVAHSPQAVHLLEPLRRLDWGPFPGDVECCDLWFKAISQAFSQTATGAGVCSKQGGQEPLKLYKVRYRGRYEQDRLLASLKSDEAT